MRFALILVATWLLVGWQAAPVDAEPSATTQVAQSDPRVSPVDLQQRKAVTKDEMTGRRAPVDEMTGKRAPKDEMTGRRAPKDSSDEARSRTKQDAKGKQPNTHRPGASFATSVKRGLQVKLNECSAGDDAKAVAGKRQCVAPKRSRKTYGQLRGIPKQGVDQAIDQSFAALGGDGPTGASGGGSRCESFVWGDGTGWTECTTCKGTKCCTCIIYVPPSSVDPKVCTCNY